LGEKRTASIIADGAVIASSLLYAMNAVAGRER
jgi:hypothetical protein